MVECATRLLACFRFLYKVVHKIGRLRKCNCARAREIELNFFIAWTMMKLGTLVDHVHGSKGCLRFFNICKGTQLCTRQNGHRGKFRCYRRFHDQGRSSDNFENWVHFHGNSSQFIGLEDKRKEKTATLGMRWIWRNAMYEPRGGRKREDKKQKEKQKKRKWRDEEETKQKQKKNKTKKQKTNTSAENTSWNPTRSSLDVPYAKKRACRHVRMMKSVIFSASSFSSHFFSVVVLEWLAGKLLIREIPFRERPGSGRQCSTTWWRSDLQKGERASGNLRQDPPCGYFNHLWS